MNPVEDHVQRLEVVLHAEEEVYCRLRDLLRREEGELINLEPSQLEATIGEKRAVAEEARLHEESRIALIQRLGALLGMEAKRPRLSEVIDVLGEEAGELPALHVRLSALVSLTRSLLGSNERFANRSLTRIQDTLKLLGQSVPEASGYGPGGHGSEKATRGRLIRASI